MMTEKKTERLANKPGSSLISKFSISDDAKIRGMDITLSVAALALCSPLMVWRMGRRVVKGESIIARSCAIGLHGQPFQVYKTHLGVCPDSIAKLLNVIKGDMTLVGPRVLNRGESMTLPTRFRDRYFVKPGIISLYRLKKTTLRGHKDEWSCDLQFVHNRSMRVVIGTLLRSTCGSLFSRHSSNPLEKPTLFGVNMTNYNKEKNLDEFTMSEDESKVLKHIKWISKWPWVYQIRKGLLQKMCSARVTWSQKVKRILDLIVAIAAILVLSPLLILTCILIKADSPGPILFSQMRIGQRGNPFRLWKFRSMVENAEIFLPELQADNEVKGGVLFKIKNDPRITRVGKYIRKFSIDELPQLFNVLIGDMSLVGPRPCLASELNQYSVSDLKRLHALPGITGEWQVSGRSNTGFEEQVSLDIDYVYQRTFTRDIKILLKTIPVVLAGRGAY